MPCNVRRRSDTSVSFMTLRDLYGLHSGGHFDTKAPWQRSDPKNREGPFRRCDGRESQAGVLMPQFLRESFRRVSLGNWGNSRDMPGNNSWFFSAFLFPPFSCDYV
jgi:hypothetical protein